MSTIFISGGSRGIGFQLVKQYASIEGNHVITTTRSIPKSAELTRLAEELGDITVLELEASSEESISALEEALPNTISDGIDLFIANAAICDAFYTILDAPRKVYEDHYNVNVLATIAVTKILYPYLLKKKTRKIIFISSAAGQITVLSDFVFSLWSI